MATPTQLTTRPPQFVRHLDANLDAEFVLTEDPPPTSANTGKFFRKIHFNPTPERRPAFPRTDSIDSLLSPEKRKLPPSASRDSIFSPSDDLSDPRLSASSRPKSRLYQSTPTPVNETDFCIAATDSPESQNQLNTILDIWQQVARERKNSSSPKNTPTPDDEEIKDNFLYDTGMLTDYSKVIGYFTPKPKPSEKPTFLALVDSSPHVQAVARLAEKEGSFYLKALIAAPWNIDMNGTIPPEYGRISPCKGGGTALVSAACNLGIERNLKSLETTPSARAKSFYTTTLGMPFDTEENKCVLPLDKPLPPRIGAYKNIPIKKEDPTKLLQFPIPTALLEPM